MNFYQYKSIFDLISLFIALYALAVDWGYAAEAHASQLIFQKRRVPQHFRDL